jgi:hypothetical protein
MFVALVMKEGMQGVDGAFPDLLFVEAEDRSAALEAIASHKPDHQRWQKKSVIRVVLLDSLAKHLETKFIGGRKRIVRTSPPRRRRRKVQ